MLERESDILAGSSDPELRAPAGQCVFHMSEDPSQSHSLQCWSLDGHPIIQLPFLVGDIAAIRWGWHRVGVEGRVCWCSMTFNHSVSEGNRDTEWFFTPWISKQSPFTILQVCTKEFFWWGLQQIDPGHLPMPLPGLHLVGFLWQIPHNFDRLGRSYGMQ